MVVCVCLPALLRVAFPALFGFRGDEVIAHLRLTQRNAPLLRQAERFPADGDGWVAEGFTSRIVSWLEVSKGLSPLDPTIDYKGRILKRWNLPVNVDIGT
jgi:hypothetical protein